MWIEVILSMTVALLIYGVLFYKRFFPTLSGAGPGSEQYLQTIIDNFLASLDHLPFVSHLSSAIFWSFTGVGIYIATIIVINLVIGIRNTVFELGLNRGAKVRFVTLTYEMRRGAWIVLALVYLYGYIVLMKHLLIRFNGDVTDKDWVALGVGLGCLSLANYLLYSLVMVVAQNPSFISLRDSS